MKLAVVRNHTTEWSCRAGVDLEDRYAELNVNAVVTTLSGAVSRVSAFWCGEDRWTVRYASHDVGVHRAKMEASDDGTVAVSG